MRPGSRETIPTVETTILAAAHVCDPDGHSGGVTAFLRSFEGDERPATAPADLIAELRSSAEAIDPQRLDPAVHATAAAASWIATNPGSEHDPELAIREGLRLYFAGEVPEEVEDWVRARGDGSR